LFLIFLLVSRFNFADYLYWFGLDFVNHYNLACFRWSINLDPTASQSVSPSVLASSPFWKWRPNLNVSSDQYVSGCHMVSSLTRGWIYLLLFVLSLSDVTVLKEKLFTYVK